MAQTELSAKPVSGAMVLRGKWVVVSFMTTWCPFCNAAAPHFDKLSQEHGKRGVKAFIVDVSEKAGRNSAGVARTGRMQTQ